MTLLHFQKRVVTNTDVPNFHAILSTAKKTIAIPQNYIKPPGLQTPTLQSAHATVNDCIRKLLDSQICFSNLSFLLVVFFFGRRRVFFDQLVSLEDCSLQFRAAIDVDSRFTLSVNNEVTNCRKWGAGVKLGFIRAYTY